MFMQLGFALLETGLCRAKNAVHTFGMNIMLYGIGVLGFWAAGYAIMFGGYGVGPSAIGWQPSLGQGLLLLNGEHSIMLFGKSFGGLLGQKGFFLNPSVFDSAVFCLFLFEMVFMDTAATIPTGALAERWNFKSFFIYGFFVSIIAYPLFGNWVWGGGVARPVGARTLAWVTGHVDFAGSSVVHECGGVIALVGAAVLGPRIGEIWPGWPASADSRARCSPRGRRARSSWPSAGLASILAPRWPAPITALRSLLSTPCSPSASGMVVAMLSSCGMSSASRTITMACNGMLAGLVAMPRLAMCFRQFSRRCPHWRPSPAFSS